VISGRSALIWGLVAERAAARREQVSAVDVCTAAVAALPVTGAWVTVPGAAGAHLMCVTGESSEQLAELQITLGEGPCLDVLTSWSPVLISDLDDAEATLRWPGFTPQARQADAAAIFALPLLIGAIRVGSLGLYRDKPGPLTSPEFGDALIFAETAAVILLDSQHADGKAPAAAGGPGGQPPDLARHRAEIDQATGMVSEQLATTMGEAFVRLRAYAYAQDRRLSDVARDIVARRLRLSPDPGPGPPQDPQR
jgi:GAF domain-containing protein